MDLSSWKLKSAGGHRQANSVTLTIMQDERLMFIWVQIISKQTRIRRNQTYVSHLVFKIVLLNDTIYNSGMHSSNKVSFAVNK